MLCQKKGKIESTVCMATIFPGSAAHLHLPCLSGVPGRGLCDEQRNATRAI
jgi:hypothetical protein